MRSFIGSALWRLPPALAVGAGIIALFGPGSRYLGSLLDGSRAVHVYSSRRSPNGSFVAESVMIGRGEKTGGRLVFRAKDGSEQSVDFPQSPVYLFLRWKDDTHLELSSHEPRTDLPNIDRLGQVSLSTRSYPFPKKPAYEGPGASNVVVPAQDVVATFDRRTNDRGYACTLKLEAARSSFDAAGVEISAIIDTVCNRPHSCLGVDTRFTLEDSRTRGRQSTLTLATVAGIPSYNRLPTGDQGTAIRGQFLGEDATRLIEELAKPSVTLNFSRDFFDQVINYKLPLPSGAISDFKRCVGDAQAM